MDFNTLKAKVEGSAIEIFDPAHRQVLDDLVWNGRKPASSARYVVRAASATDVQLALAFARANGLRVSPRGGGHNFAGIALAGDVIVDVSELATLHIEPAGATAIVGPGVTNERLAAALERNNLAFPVGHCATVPVSGYLLGGGVGWNSGEWGIACFSVRAAEVVLADGSRILTTDQEHADVLWAVRGAGPEFFGVVTAYHLDLKPLPRGMMSAVHVFAPHDVQAVGQWAERAMARSSPNMEFTVKIAGLPPHVEAPEGAFGLAAIATVFAASEQAALEALGAFFADAPDTAVERIGPMPSRFETLYALTSASAPKGKRYAVDSLWSDAPFGAILTRMVEGYGARPSEHSFGLASLRSPLAKEPGPGAFSRIGQTFATLYTIWDDDREDVANLRWMRDLVGTVSPMATGTYVGESDLELEGRRVTIHAPEAAARLDALKAQYDPQGLMRRLPAPAGTAVAA